MQIVLHVNRYFDWQPVDAETEVTDADIAAKQVKPAQDGKWLMKVEKDANTETLINIPEGELHETIVQEFTRGDKQTMTREQLVHRYATRHHLEHNTHPDWIQEVAVHDDGPDEAGLRALLDVHVKCGNIQARDVERIVATYLQPSSADTHVDHLHKAYGVTPERIDVEQKRRQAHRDATAASNAAHLATVTDVAAKAAAAKTVKGARR